MANNNQGLFHFLFKSLGEFINIRSVYENIKSNPESKKVSSVLAKKAIKYNLLSLIMVALTFACVYASIMLFKGFGIILSIFLILFGLTFVLYAILFLILSLNCIIKQFLLNRRAWTWIALLIHILVLAALTIAIFILISKVL